MDKKQIKVGGFRGFVPTIRSCNVDALVIRFLDFGYVTNVVPEFPEAPDRVVAPLLDQLIHSAPLPDGNLMS